MSSYGTYYGTDEAFYAMLFGILGVVLVVAFVVCFMMVIGLWKTFKKAGEEGWKAIVPVYNTYVLCKISGTSPWWILIAYVANVILAFFGPLAFLGILINFYFNIILSHNISKSFGYDVGFTVGLIFLRPIFYLILGFGKSEYKGIAEAQDPVMGAILKNSGSSSTTTNMNSGSNNMGTSKFCAHCGTQLSVNDQFCPSCGSRQ